MKRDGQVWLDHNDHESAYIVVDGPKPNNSGGWAHFVMLDMAKGELVEWSEEPLWEDDRLLTRIV